MSASFDPSRAPAPRAQAIRVMERKRRLVRACRVDPACFAAYVLRDEETGKPVRLAPMHDVWHQLITDNDRLLLWAHVESGKSSQVTVGRTLYELGRDPTLRCCVLSNTFGQSKKLLSVIKRYMESSGQLREVFPDLRPADPWAEAAITIKRPTISKDPSVQATSLGGHILGSRLDLVIVDDILDFENTLSESGREQTWSWFNANIMGRLTARARVVVVGNAHHPEDMMHRLAKQPGWRALRYPVIDDQTGRPRWPERWSSERIEKARKSWVPIEFARQLLCVARDDASAKFQRAWIDVALRRGEGKRPCWNLNFQAPGYWTYTGVDLAVQRHSAADLTCLFTIIVHPDGTREVLSCESGRWAGPDIVARIIDAHRRYNSIVWVENNAAQDFIRQYVASSSAVPIHGFTTGRNKAHPEFGVESLGAEMEAGKWIIPNEGGVMHAEIASWVQDMLHYDPREHTGDRLMASWFAREGARQGDQKVEGFSLNTLTR